MLVIIFILYDKVTHSVARLYYKCILKRILYVTSSDTFPKYKFIILFLVVCSVFHFIARG